MTRSGVSGSSRTRNPSAYATALALAPPVGPWAASRAPAQGKRPRDPPERQSPMRLRMRSGCACANCHSRLNASSRRSNANDKLGLKRSAAATGLPAASLRPRFNLWRPSFGVGLRSVVDAQLADLAGNRVAAHAKQTGRLDAPAARMRKSLDDQRLLETLGERFQDIRLAVCQSAIRLARERREPLGRGRRGILAQLRRKIAHLDHLGRRHYGEPMTNIFKLAHVAGKGLDREVGHRVIRQALGLDAELAG